MTATLDGLLASRLTVRAAVEQLAPWARAIDPDVIVMRSEGSQWLIDIGRRRFQRLDGYADPHRHALSGAWTPFRDLAFFGRNAALVIELESGSRFRTQIRSIDPDTTRGISGTGIPPP